MNTPSDVQQYKFFAPWSVGFATLLGTPLAGAILLSLNYRFLGKKQTAIQVLVVGFGVSLLLMSFLLMPNMPKHLEWLGLIQGVCAAFVAKWLQGEAYEQHVQLGGKVASIWDCVKIAILSIAVILIVGMVGHGVGTIFLH